MGEWVRQRLVMLLGLDRYVRELDATRVRLHVLEGDMRDVWDRLDPPRPRHLSARPRQN